MLLELHCSKFHEPSIYFHNGLNVILGDDSATNSIGKSSLLLILDFVYGGNDFIKFDNGAVDNIGPHDFNFCFLFANNKYYFKRKTNNPGVVYKCDNNYTTIKSLELQDYISFLDNKYDIRLEKTSFRQFTGLFCREWGKKNLVVSKPLHSVPENNMTECIERLIDYFTMYKTIDGFGC